MFNWGKINKAPKKVDSWEKKNELLKDFKDPRIDLTPENLKSFQSLPKILQEKV